MTADGDVDGFHLFIFHQNAKVSYDQPIAIIMLVANAEFYELDGLFSKDHANMQPMDSMIMCNYRGTGRSGNRLATTVV